MSAYLERCRLKTGKLFEAACALGRRKALALRGRLGIAFQIADDILDCASPAIETGKVAGTDLREGTPTLPLLLAAREDAAVQAALAGGPLTGVLLRVAATGALERSREVALDYARRARESLNGGSHRGARVARRRRRQPEALDRSDGHDRTNGLARADFGAARRHVLPVDVAMSVRLGRISYVNMAPVFHRLNADVEEVPGASRPS